MHADEHGLRKSEDEDIKTKELSRERQPAGFRFFFAFIGVYLCESVVPLSLIF
jgi:hypothetical protein